MDRDTSAPAVGFQSRSRFTGGDRREISRLCLQRTSAKVECYCAPPTLFRRIAGSVLPSSCLDSIQRCRSVPRYRTSRAHPLSTWLVDIQWADGRSVRSPGRGTTCSPFTTQSVAMAYSPLGQTPLRPMLSDGRPLSFLFSRAASAHKIQHLGNEAGIPSRDDVAKVRAEFEKG